VHERGCLLEREEQICGGDLLERGEIIREKKGT
jgi:hypothetical protein